MTLTLSVRVPGCQKLQMTAWHSMLCSCTLMATVGVKGLSSLFYFSEHDYLIAVDYSSINCTRRLCQHRRRTGCQR